MKRILYLMQKEFRQFFRERANVGIIIVMPLVQLVVLGFAITTDVKHIQTVIVDQDHSVFSRELVDHIRHSEQFRVVAETPAIADGMTAIHHSAAVLAVVIPPHFEARLLSRQAPDVQVLLDGVDANSAGISNGFITQLMLETVNNFLAQKLPGRQAASLIQTEPRFEFNPQLESKYNIIPGILVVLVTMITMLLTALNLVREKEMGTLEQLMVTPIRKSELMLGKVLPYMFFGFILLNVGLLSSWLVFGIVIKGSIWLLYGISLIYMFTTLGLGILISTIAQNQMQAMFLSFFFAIFTVLMSGFFIPIENMPEVVQWLTHINPARYFMTVVRAIFLKQATFADLKDQVLYIAVFGITVLSLAILRFRKRIS